MPNDASSDETRMRAALGLLGRQQPQSFGNRPAQSSPSSPRRRFVRDGEVAMTVVNPATSDDTAVQSPRDKLMGLQDALAAEQTAHARTKRALHEAHVAMQAIETKHAHEAIAQAEAVRQEQATRAQLEAGHLQLQTKLQETEAQLQETAARLQQAELRLQEAEAKIRARQEADAEMRAQQEADAEMRAQQEAEAMTPAQIMPSARSLGRVAQARKKVPEGAEPEPVKWWLPGYGAEKRRR